MNIISEAYKMLMDTNKDSSISANDILLRYPLTVREFFNLPLWQEVYDTQSLEETALVFIDQLNENEVTLEQLDILERKYEKDFKALENGDLGEE